MSTGTGMFFLLAVFVSLGLTVVQGNPKIQWNPAPLQDIKKAVLLLCGIVFFYLTGTPEAMIYFIGAFLLCILLRCLTGNALLRGIILLLAGFWLFQHPSETALPILASLFGLTAGRLMQVHSTNADWTDYVLPAALLIGAYWINLAVQSSHIPPFHNVLLICIAVSLLLRAMQQFAFFPKHPIASAALVVVLGTLASWLAIQTLLVQPALLKWAWLFGGGLLLGKLLNAIHTTDTQSTDITKPLIAFILIGIGTLVASRLFGTLGWLVLATGLLANTRFNLPLMVGILFLLGRSLLQGFVYEFNPNVTGINITHPYASAALYIGLISMLVLPSLLNQCFPPKESAEKTETPFPWLLLLIACLPIGLLANYFLHAEATGSLLTALIVGAVGVSLLGRFNSINLAVLPLAISSFIINGAMLASSLIASGNEASKGPKVLMLLLALTLYAVLFFLMQRGGLSRKPVEIA